jgi:CBS domain-containing protein
MTKNCETLHPGEMLADALTRMQESDCQIAPVIDNGKLVGLLTLENIGEFMMIQSALESARARER